MVVSKLGDWLIEVEVDTDGVVSGFISVTTGPKIGVLEAFSLRGVCG